MVKSKFPGKPSKHFHRRKVSPAINIEDFEGLKAAEDIYCRLSLFDFLFREEEEVSSFHGFSPHEYAKPKSMKKIKSDVKSKKKCFTVGSCSTSNSKSTKKESKDKNNLPSTTQNIEVCSNSDINGTENDTNDENMEKLKKTNSGPVIPLTGKFVLPSRSAHSSRVIKPNKRFIQSESDDGVPYKKQRLKQDVDVIINNTDNNVPEESVSSENTSIDKFHSSDSNISDSSPNSASSSPVKFVLRKPRLKIKSQPFSKVEGPFSSPGNRNGLHGGSKYRSCPATKVVCGVCWTVRSYKFLMQARKFGIFACEPCRRFILKVLKTEREKLLQPLTCMSGTGNCPIRNSTFVSHQPFGTPPKKSQIEAPRRCQGCWLNLCLRSFKMPLELSKRLATYLPSEVLQKYPISSLISSYNELPNKSAEMKNTEVSVVKVIKKRKPAEETKKGKNRQKLLLAGPRVKHVCRSASLVLGQPAATFLGNSSKSELSNHSFDDDTFSTKSNSSNGEAMVETDIRKQDYLSADKDNNLKDKNTAVEKPVARMLQDLGRANCELLDGIELHESEKKFAKISIDFWESYDPEEVLQSGFPLLGCNPFPIRAICFLCGSAGYEKLVHCSYCCEPYHTFCVSSTLHFATKDKNWWKLDWLCPKCIHCEICSKVGGVQLTCSKCSKSYHNNCVPPGRAHISDNSWVCPACLFCKSCNDTQVHVFIGNVPLCKNCFKQRKKGNFCPLCQRCYDENDYSTKMMECSDCKSWIHAHCEGLSDEKYQVLSNLPSTIEFVCRNCCKDPPALWSVAVNAELRAGYLNVIRALSKNRSICSYLKTSPKKIVCACQDANRKPIHLKSLSGQSDISLLNNKNIHSGSPLTITDEKNTDLGLLTPKLTKDDEESLQTVKSGFLNLVSNKENDNEKELTIYSLTNEIETKNNTYNRNSSQLLSIACNNTEINSDCRIKKYFTQNELNEINSGSELSDISEKTCSCKGDNTNVSSQPFSLMVIKSKAMNDDYSSILEFSRDMEKVIKEINRPDILKMYYKALRQIFPWFDPKDTENNESTILGLESFSENKLRECRKSIEGGENESVQRIERNNSVEGLLSHDQNYYYVGLDLVDDRICMLCKLIGEGKPNQEGRLLYCGQNEWVHVNCALWSSEVFEEIDGSLQNVHSAISRARLIRCFGCDKKGASVGCCAKSCPSAYHFGCAINANCVFLENKEVFCKMHKNLSSVKDVHKEEDFSIARSVYVELDHKKKKDVLRNEVRLCLGSLSIINLGEIIPELSDMEDILLPCEFHCSRLYWSSKEPWKLVRYYIKTKVTHTYQEQILEGETNYTIDHSLEFTPPPSPVDEMFQINSTQYPVDEKDIKLVVNYIIDTICSKEDENNISEQATTDLLPPELKEAIFEDLPHDLLDGISMHDIFTKMNFDDILSEVKHESSTYGESSHVENVKKSFIEEQKRHELINKNKLLKTNTVKSNKNLVKSHNFFRDRKGNSSSIKSEQFLSKVKDRSWKSCKLLQVDGAVDLSESDQSDDSCDMISNSTNNFTNITSMEDDPVKCSRCHRTYRSNVGYERHLSSCNYLSSSECESSEEERDKPVDCLMENNSCDVDTNMLDTTMQRNIQTSINQPESNGTILNQISSNITTMSVDTTSSICPVEQSVVCPVEQAAICSVEQTISSNSSISMNGGTQLPNTLNINMNHMNGELNPFKTNKLSLSAGEFNEEQVSLNSRPYENYINHTSEQQSIVEIENSIPSAPPPTIILQQMPTENVIPTYIPSYSQSSQQNIQYITSVDSQDKFITSSHLTPGTYHIQSAQTIQQPVVQNVPTVVGTIIQTNGVDQIVLNGANSSLDMYTQPQNNLYITNTPMIVGMETVVSNTVMSSSQFISASMPGMLAASSYSATTTQVFQATKPVIDIPQSYVVVNTNPPIIENNTSCVQPSIIQNNVVSQPTPWNNLIQCQDPYKLNKNVSYQTVTRQIIHEQKEIDGVKMINSTQETIVIEPIAATSSENNVEQIPKITAPVINEQPTFSQPPSSFRRVVQNVKHNGHAKTNHVKIVELPKSSSVCKEKPQQAVAPVVVKKVLENGIKNVNICKKPSVKPETAICDIPSKINPVETTLQTIETTPPTPVCNPEIKKSPEIKKVEVKFDDVIAKKDDIKHTNNIIKNTTKITDNISDNTPVLPKQTEVNSVKSSVNKPSAKTKRENPNIRKVIQEEPKITYEITSDDGFSYSTNNIKIAWEKVFEKVQKAREAKGLPPLTENPFSSPSTMLKKMMGLGNNSVKYVLEQLPGASGCSKYKPMYHQKKLSLLEQEMSKDLKGNISGCARTEVFKHTRHKYDMFSWLASRHRRPPKLLAPDNDCINGGRRTNMNLPMAMRFRHLKEASNAVGVFRSDIHGRGLFCLRDIDSGEMVIEYAGEVIRSALTDKRERYYTAKGIGCYMFRIDDKFVVDATMKGNAARFINHSCEPNCYSKVVDILGKKHILIFAMRRILQGEELTYDYKFPLEEEKINCHCLSRRCRKYLN